MFEQSTALHVRVRCAFAALGFVSTTLASNVARADEGADTTAFQLYEEGKRAYDAGEYETAGKLLSRADSVAPNTAVLDLAMAAARKAEDPVLGMELVERAEQRGLASSARAGREVFATGAGRLSISCPGSKRCEAHVDGTLWNGQQSRWLRVGEHAVLLESDGHEENFSVHVEGAKTMLVRPTRVVQILPPPPPPAPVQVVAAEQDATPKRISSAWFWGGVVTTAALGAATTVSGIDTLGKRSDFRAAPYNDDLASSGRLAETRTNVLLVSTIVAAAATTALAYFAWRPQRHVR